MSLLHLIVAHAAIDRSDDPHVVYCGHNADVARKLVDATLEGGVFRIVDQYSPSAPVTRYASPEVVSQMAVQAAERAAKAVAKANKAAEAAAAEAAAAEAAAAEAAAAEAAAAGTEGADGPDDSGISSDVADAAAEPASGKKKR